MSDLQPSSSNAVTTVTVQEERARRNFTAAEAKNTQEAYASDWRLWEHWAAENGNDLFPADPEAVALFVSDMSADRKISTIRRYVATISTTHTKRGETFNTRHPALRRMLRGIANQKSGDTRQVKPLTATLLRDMWPTFGNDIKDLRDKTLLALGVASGFRRSELVALDWREYGDGNGRFEMTPNGATLWLRRSKASQQAPQAIHIPPGLTLQAVREWVSAAEIERCTPLFRKVTRHGSVASARLRGDSVGRIVKACVERAGLDPSEFSGHSLRAGMVTSAAEVDWPEWRIQMHSRHKSNAMVRTYVRNRDVKKASPVTAMGL